MLLLLERDSLFALFLCPHILDEKFYISDYVLHLVLIDMFVISYVVAHILEHVNN